MAYLLYDGFWNAYACIRQPNDTTQPVGGGTLLGPPIGEKRLQNAALRQDFKLGWMLQSGVGKAVEIHLNAPVSVDPAVTSQCPNVSIVAP
jgi:hypothetical protein